MERQEIFEIVEKIICEIMCDAGEQIAEDSGLVDDLGFDSLEAMELMTEIEDEFEITIDEAQTNRFSTVKDIIDYVEKAVAGE